MPVRLACVKHAASVHSEPGSNSQVHQMPQHSLNHAKTINELDPAHSIIQSASHKTRKPLEASINVVKDTSTNAPINDQATRADNPSKPNHKPPHISVQAWNAANVSLPIPDEIVKERFRSFRTGWVHRRRERRSTRGVRWCQREFTQAKPRLHRASVQSRSTKFRIPAYRATSFWP